MHGALKSGDKAMAGGYAVCIGQTPIVVTPKSPNITNTNPLILCRLSLAISYKL